MDKIIENISEQFLKDDCVKIITPFSVDSDFWISGKIVIEFRGVKLPFEITIPFNYPLTQPHSDNISINFVNMDLIGYSHVNNNGSVCFHPDKDDDLERKVAAELSGLKEWISDYYVNDKEDERYTYLIPPIKSSRLSTLYFGGVKRDFRRGDFGDFSYSLLSKNERVFHNGSSLVHETYFRIGFDEKNEDRWSEDFLTLLKKGEVKQGLWCYIEEEPLKKVEKKRLLTESWQELQSYLPQDFIIKTYQVLRRKNKSHLCKNELFILLGYKIPTLEGYETHWNLIKIPMKNIPFRSKKIAGAPREIFCTNKEVIWGSTVNSSYDRFFGRGGVSSKLANARILVIGVGALGSSLSEILVRGGVKNIFIDDFDIVETGNLCRANYTLNDLNLTKVDSLKNRLLSISPFVNVRTREFKLNTIKKEILENNLNEMFDYVFDCSTDPEVALIFDKINFGGQVFSLGLTNKSNHLTCITGGNIAQETAALYDCLENEPASFFEGTGCGYPTFSASFNDINTVLNVSIKNINESITANNTVTSFYVKNITPINSQVEIIEYDTFFQEDTKQQMFFPKALFKKIEAILLQHYPKEFGGILIGSKSSSFNTVLIDNILLPDRYESNKTQFTRHPQSLNKILEDVFEKSNGRIEYLGEFHSHPNTSIRPSTIDDKAIAEIAQESKVTTKNPILLIARISIQSITEVGFYIFNKTKLYKYE